MPLVSISLPHDVASKFSEIEVPGSKTSEKSKHITLFYIDDEIVYDSIKIFSSLLMISGKQSPFMVSVQKIKNFPEGDNGFPIIGEVVSQQLLDFREKIKNIFDKLGIAHSKRFPVYRPHVTLSYSDEEIEETEVDEISWEVDEITFLISEEDDSAEDGYRNKAECLFKFDN